MLNELGVNVVCFFCLICLDEVCYVGFSYFVGLFVLEVIVV